MAEWRQVKLSLKPMELILVVQQCLGQQLQQGLPEGLVHLHSQQDMVLISMELLVLATVSGEWDMLAINNILSSQLMWTLGLADRVEWQQRSRQCRD